MAPVCWRQQTGTSLQQVLMEGRSNNSWGIRGEWQKKRRWTCGAWAKIACRGWGQEARGESLREDIVPHSLWRVNPCFEEVDASINLLPTHSRWLGEDWERRGWENSASGTTKISYKSPEDLSTTPQSTFNVPTSNGQVWMPSSHFQWSVRCDSIVLTFHFLPSSDEISEK